MTKKHVWSEAERDIVRTRYAGTNVSAQLLASEIGVTYNAIKGQVAFLGLARQDRSHWKNWNPEEEDWLWSLSETYAPRTIARKMHRSLNSVVVRMKILGIRRRARVGWYTKEEACQILGVDHHWLQKRIDNGALAASYHDERRPSQGGLSRWHIKERDLRNFICRYPEDLVGRNIDVILLVDLLTGVLLPNGSSKPSK